MTEANDDQTANSWMQALGNLPRGGLVAIAALVALVVIVAIGYTDLPKGADKGAQIVAMSSAAFGVIGAIVGAYFGVTASNAAVSQANDQHAQLVAALAPVQPAGPKGSG